LEPQDHRACFRHNLLTLTIDRISSGSQHKRLPYNVIDEGLRRSSGVWALLRRQWRQPILRSTYCMRGKVTAVCWLRRSHPRPLCVGTVAPLSRRTLCLHVLPSAAASQCLPRVRRPAVLPNVFHAAWWSMTNQTGSSSYWLYHGMWPPHLGRVRSKFSDSGY